MVKHKLDFELTNIASYVGLPNELWDALLLYCTQMMYRVCILPVNILKSVRIMQL